LNEDGFTLKNISEIYGANHEGFEKFILPHFKS
jgi:hypothetical protein